MRKKVKKDQKNILAELQGFLDNDWIEQNLYKRIKKSDIDTAPVFWGEGVSILIVCDKGYGRAKVLYEFLSEKTAVSSVALIKNISEFRKYVKITVPDILIFSATQENEENYMIYDLLKKRNPKAFKAMYAFYDFHVEKVCSINKIFCIGDCNEKTSVFIDMLIWTYDRIHRK